MKFAALFPGQGSQYVGMIKTLREQFPFTHEIFEEASEALNEDIVKLCLEGPSDTLQLTLNAQPTILTTSYAWFQVLKHHLDFKPAAAAGHSLGEYSALLAAGAMTLTEAVKLVRTRGQLMQVAVPQGKGKMAAIIGLNDDKIKELCQFSSQGAHSLVVPANFNAPSQVVIAGHAEAVDKASQIASGADPSRPDLKARKAIALSVSAPFHCPLMKPVAEQFMLHLEKVAWKTPSFPVAANVDAKLRQQAEVTTLLKDQIDHPVLWTSCVQSLKEAGFTKFVEMGPSKVLTGLVKRIAEDAKVYSLDSLDDFKNFESAYQEVMQ